MISHTSIPAIIFGIVIIGLVLPAHVDSVEEHGRPHPDAGAAAEFSGILRSPVADHAAGVLGGEPDPRFRPPAIWNWRPRTTGQRANHVWQDYLPQRRDVFHFGLRRHCADVEYGARTVGARSVHGLCVSGRGDRLFASGV